MKNDEIYRALFKGGLSYDLGVTENDVNPDELSKGIEVEYEHVNIDSSVAYKIVKKIALDHLAECSDYYTRLSKMEKECEGNIDMKENKLKEGWKSVKDLITRDLKRNFPNARVSQNDNIVTINFGFDTPKGAYLSVGGSDTMSGQDLKINNMKAMMDLEKLAKKIKHEDYGMENDRSAFIILDDIFYNESKQVNKENKNMKEVAFSRNKGPYWKVNPVDFKDITPEQKVSVIKIRDRERNKNYDLYRPKSYSSHIIIRFSTGNEWRIETDGENHQIVVGQRDESRQKEEVGIEDIVGQKDFNPKDKAITDEKLKIFDYALDQYSYLLKKGTNYKVSEFADIFNEKYPMNDENKNFEKIYKTLKEFGDLTIRVDAMTGRVTIM